MFFIGKEGWVVGGYYPDTIKIYHTTVGGLTFTNQYPPINSGEGMSIFMRSLQDGYTVTNTDRVLRTQDGGINWTTIGSLGGLLYSVSFPPLPEPTGYICGTGGNNGKFLHVTGSFLVLDTVITVGSLFSISFPVNSNETKKMIIIK